MIDFFKYVINESMFVAYVAIFVGLISYFIVYTFIQWMRRKVSFKEEMKSNGGTIIILLIISVIPILGVFSDYCKRDVYISDADESIYHFYEYCDGITENYNEVEKMQDKMFDLIDVLGDDKRDSIYSEIDRKRDSIFNSGSVDSMNTESYYSYMYKDVMSKEVKVCEKCKEYGYMKCR